MSAIDYTGQDSNSVLLAAADGTFTEQGVDFFADIATTMLEQTSGALNTNMQTMAIVSGPAGEKYLVGAVERESAQSSNLDVYLAELSTLSQNSAPAMVMFLNEIEPEVMPDDALELLTVIDEADPEPEPEVMPDDATELPVELVGLPQNDQDLVMA